MPGCGCTGTGGGGGSCAFSNAGNVTFSGSCAAGIVGDVDGSEVLNDVTAGTFDECASFQIPVKQGGVWVLATLSTLRCAQIV